jgi:crotonobetaine/carnitine-CoA ligase
MVRVDEPWTLNVGYWGKPEATVRAWRNGWYHTGDAFRMDAEGNYFFVDRYKDAIRRRGENISSMEVEALVVGHPDVSDAAAVGVPSDVEEEDVFVFVVTAERSALTPGDLHEYLRGVMPRYMVPRYIEFVDKLPRTPTQKIRKVELRSRGVSTETFDMTKEAKHVR